MTVRYLLALALIALLTLTSDIVLTSVLTAHTHASTIINVSGRQRMLSQRVASLAVQYEVMGDPEARSDLLTATAEMKTNFQVLFGNNREKNMVRDPRIRTLYLAGPNPVSSAVPDFIKLASAIAAAPPYDKAMMPQLHALLAQARAPLLDPLNAMTGELVRKSYLQLNKMRNLQTISLLLVLLTLAFEAIWVFRPMVRRIVENTAELTRNTVMDLLTEVHNRRGFLWRAEIELKRAARHQQPVGLMIVDIDHFKRINDTYGHEAGDRVLKTLGRLFLQSFRTTDVVGRWGGEEFAILLPETAIKPAYLLADRICAEVANMAFELGDTTEQITISIGVADIPSGSLDIGEPMRRADMALYRAKDIGRNRVEVAPQSSTREPATAQ